MKKVNTSSISGMQELLPSTQAVFNSLKAKIADVYYSHGFLNIETPTIDRAEILFAKAGGDTEKQVYKVFKTAETADESDQALRFDHTVPLARYVVEHESDLTFPFKVTQIGRNFRGERAQKGRFREFYQCDIDIIGRNNLPITYDSDIIVTLLDTFKSFELDTPVLARINNRKILSGLLEYLKLSDKAAEIFNVIDHSEKVPTEKTKEGFKEIGLSDKEVAKMMAFINLHGGRDVVISNLEKLKIENETYKAGVSELDEVMYLLEMQDKREEITADMRIIRGLDYYTGTVFEFILPEHKEIGSVCGGGRYENLTGYFSDQAMPGVGGSIGLTRLFYILNEKKLLKNKNASAPLDYAIIPMSIDEFEYSFKTAKKLRNLGFSVDVVLTDKRLGDKMSYAAKVAEKGIVIGGDEVKSGALKAKDFATGEELPLEF